MVKKIAFLDRDGVINIDGGYVHQLQDLEFLPGLDHGLLELQRQNYQLFIVTNQSGIGRGFYTEQKFHEFMQQMLQQLNNRGIKINGYEFCPHHEDATELSYKLKCHCRKPAPGMIKKILAREGVKPMDCIMVGDKITDINAGIRAGVASGFLIGQDSDQASDLELISGWHQVNDWYELVTHLRSPMFRKTKEK